MCGYCDIENNVEPIKIFTDDEYEKLIVAIAGGLVTVANLPEPMYLKIARKLTDGVFEGFGKDFEGIDINSDDYRMLFDLRRNVWVFSGAKTYQQVREVSELLTYPDKNEILTFADFKKKAKNILVEYNENWLSAEYGSAISQSRSASQWMQFEKDADLYDKLEYHTVGDSRVRPTHAALDGIVRPVNDKFWDNYMPPNGWRCRCTVLQGDDEMKTTSLKGFKQPDDVPDVFMMNAGKDRIVYSPKHPYFKVEPKDKALARNNFNLPLP